MPRAQSGEDISRAPFRAYRESPSEEMRNQLALDNRCLIGLAIKKLIFEIPDTEMPDFEQEGFIGLMKAVERYNPEMGEFSTYAMFWINKYLLMYMKEMQSGNIRIPPYIFDLAAALDSVMEGGKLTQGEANDWVLAQYLECDISAVEDVRLAFHVSNTTSLSTQAISEQAGSGTISLEDRTPDEKAENPQEVAITRYLLGVGLKGLTQPEVTMLYQYAEGKSLREIGQAFSMSGEGARKKIIRTFQKVRCRLGVDTSLAIGREEEGEKKAPVRSSISALAKQLKKKKEELDAA